MRKMLAVTTAAAALMFAAGPGYAQNASMYVTGEGDEMMVMGGDNAEGARVLRTENFEEPEDCPEGSYFMSAENEITACGEGGATFGVAAPTADQTGFPEGAMVMTPMESGEQKQTDTGAEGDDSDQGGAGGEGNANQGGEGGGNANEGGDGGMLPK